MSFAEFTLENVEGLLGLTIEEADLFPNTTAIRVPDWLPGLLARGTRLAWISEKARSEFIVVPILLAVRELSCDQVAIYSGQSLNVDPDKGLIGECDFILALGPAMPPLRAPVMTVVEAKKNDIEVGMGQCIAQMAAASRFNQSTGRPNAPMFGCVTTGETWQFLRISDQRVLVHSKHLYLDNLLAILSALHAVFLEATDAEASHRLSA
jgi:hypothetical protein